jgi:glycine/D-amino acid oxidase-like deaminating enzyme
MEEVRRKYRFYSERGVEAEILDAPALRAAEPRLRPGLAGALLVPGDSVIYPPCAAAYLLKRSNATVLHRRAIALSDGQVLLADGSTISAGTVVNAAGIHAARLSPGLSVPIQPRKGHLLITDRYPGFVRHQLVELGYLKSAHSTTSDSVAFNVQPRLTGQLLIGSSRQYGAHDPSADGRILSAMLSRAAEYMPDLTGLSAIRVWTGFRAATPDKLPLIGPCPGYRNVLIAAGHEGLGITTSLATGRLVADQILGRPPAIPMEPYRCLT